MSTELALPHSGELVDLGNPGFCARALEDIRSLEQHLREAKRILTEALVEEASRQGTKTLHLSNADVSVSGGSQTEWDIEELNKLLDAGLPVERFTDLVTMVVSYKVNAAVAKQISAANPDYAEIIQKARSEAPAAYRVAVKLAAGALD